MKKILFLESLTERILLLSGCRTVSIYQRGFRARTGVEISFPKGSAANEDGQGMVPSDFYSKVIVEVKTVLGYTAWPYQITKVRQSILYYNVRQCDLRMSLCH